MLYDDGLDTVELLMVVEDLFGIQIPDADAEKLKTPGELTDWICRKVGIRVMQRSDDICISMIAFHRTRTAAANLLGLHAQILRPSTPLESLIPSKNRKNIWSELCRLLGARAPRLELPRWMGFIAFAGVPIGILVRVSGGAAASGFCTAACFSPVIGIIIMSVVEWRTGYRIPVRCSTLGALSVLAIPKAMSERNPNASSLTRSQVMQIVRAMTAWNAEMPAKCVHENSRFTRLVAGIKD